MRGLTRKSEQSFARGKEGRRLKSTSAIEWVQRGLTGRQIGMSWLACMGLKNAYKGTPGDVITGVEVERTGAS